MEDVAAVRSAANVVAVFAFLFALALVIHFILLSTDRFNWLDGPQQRAEPPSQNGAALQIAAPAETVGARGLIGIALAHFVDTACDRLRARRRVRRIGSWQCSALKENTASAAVR